MSRAERTADRDCVEFLRWALPRLGKRWEGYRKVRRQVCRRVRRRAVELGQPGVAAYRDHLERHPDEWEALDALTCITISRFRRDRGVFDRLAAEVLPALVADRGALRAWSAGCASGEEPYTLAIVWELELAARFPDVRLDILATDIDPAMLARARAARYSRGSLRELPEDWVRQAFAEGRDGLRLRERFRGPVRVARHDLRDAPPAGAFDLVLCRNLAFTYFDERCQRDVLGALAAAARPGAALVIGAHERLPAGDPRFRPWSESHGIHRRSADGAKM